MRLCCWLASLRRRGGHITWVESLEHTRWHPGHLDCLLTRIHVLLTEEYVGE